MANPKAVLLKVGLRTKMENSSIQTSRQSHLILAHLCITAAGTSMTALLTSKPTNHQEMYVASQIIQLSYHLYSVYVIMLTYV
jgi:hypothetical protein